MKKEQIQELFVRFEAASGTIKGVECWSARELQSVLGYAEWRNFTTVIDKARESSEAAGEKTNDHFVGINKMVTLGSGSERTIEDIALTRYACYLIAQNGDPAKPAIAFAQTYFAEHRAAPPQRTHPGGRRYLRSMPHWADPSAYRFGDPKG